MSKNNEEVLWGIMNEDLVDDMRTNIGLSDDTEDTTLEEKIKETKSYMNFIGQADPEGSVKEYYDLPSAFADGVDPDNLPGGKYMHDLHPNRFQESGGLYYDKKYNEYVRQEDVFLWQNRRNDFEDWKKAGKLGARPYATKFTNKEFRTDESIKNLEEE